MAALEQEAERVVYASSIVALGSYGKECLAKEDAEFNLWETGAHY